MKYSDIDMNPMGDVAPGWRHPDTGQGIGTLLETVGDDGTRVLETA
jgi:hypothetical protein